MREWEEEKTEQIRRISIHEKALEEMGGGGEDRTKRKEMGGGGEGTGQRGRKWDGEGKDRTTLCREWEKTGQRERKWDGEGGDIRSSSEKCAPALPPCLVFIE